MRYAAIIALILVTALLATSFAAPVKLMDSSNTNGDKDGDGVSDDYENSTWFTDYGGTPHYILIAGKYDSWNDGLSDGQKVNLGLVDYMLQHNLSYEIGDEPNGDYDLDGLRDDVEVALGLNPFSADSDNDGIPDYYEITYFTTDPLNNDTDGDGLLDGVEVSHALYAIWHINTDCYELPQDTDPLNPDTDGDGLNDYMEAVVISKDLGVCNSDKWGSANPLVADTDGDGLNDYQEWNFFHKWTNYTPTILKALITPDTDGDGLSDYDEYLIGTDPTNPNSDDDGLDDFKEIMFGLDPLNNDTDGDGLDDWLEVNIGKSDPTIYDTDGDGLNDYQELYEYYGLNVTNPDTDGDGLSDYDEVMIYHTDPTNPDEDNDGLNDSIEVHYGTNASNDDTDGDGLNDYMEIKVHTDPLNPDDDGDGLNDYYEWYYGTDPHNADSDNDGLNDSAEKNMGTDPWNPDTDGDGTPDGSDSDPGTSDYWNSAHYLPEIRFSYYMDGSGRDHHFRAGDKTNITVYLHGNVGKVNLSVEGPGEINITSLQNDDTSYTKTYHVSLTFRNFEGNFTHVLITATPENGDTAYLSLLVENPVVGVNTTLNSTMPLNYPVPVYFNFTSKVKSFSISMDGGSYSVKKIENNGVLVDLKFTAKGKHTMTVNANFYNSSTYHRKFYVFAGVDEFSKYEERLNDLVAKVRKYMDITVDTKSLRNRYYSGDKSALNDLKSMIRVEALTLTAAVMMDHFADSLASAAVDVVSFKTLLNILMDKIKESATYKEIVERITERINMLAARIMARLQIDDSLIDELVDKITEQAGEALDSTISQYRDALKNKIKGMFFSPLKNAHDVMIYQNLSKEEEARRRMLIYQYAGDGIGTENLFSGISEISESIDEASTIIGGFLNGVPSYKAAMEITGKVASIFALAAKGLENYNSYRVINDIIDAYEGKTATKSLSLRDEKSEENMIFHITAGENGDVLTKMNTILQMNYTEPALMTDQVKLLTYAYTVLERNGSMAMLNSIAERYDVWVKNAAWWSDAIIVNISVPDAVIANRSFNISIETEKPMQLFAGNKSVFGTHANFTFSLPAGEYEIRVGAGNESITTRITSVEINKMQWKVIGDVVYAQTPAGLVAINPAEYNETPESLINGTAEQNGNEGNGEENENGGGEENSNEENGNGGTGESENNNGNGGTGGGEGKGNSSGSILENPMMFLIGGIIFAIVLISVVAIIFKRKKK